MATTIGGIYDRIAEKLSITREELQSMEVFCPVGDAVGAIVGERIRARFGIEGDERLALGLFDRDVLTWIEYRVMEDADLVILDQDADLRIQRLGEFRSLVIGRFDYPPRPKAGDEAGHAEENARVEDFVRETVHEWLVDQEIDMERAEIRLGDMEPGEIRVYSGR